MEDIGVGDVIRLRGGATVVMAAAADTVLGRCLVAVVFARGARRTIVLSTTTARAVRMLAEVFGL